MTLTVADMAAPCGRMAWWPPRGVRGLAGRSADLHPGVQAGDRRGVRPASRWARAGGAAAPRGPVPLPYPAMARGTRKGVFPVRTRAACAQSGGGGNRAAAERERETHQRAGQDKGRDRGNGKSTRALGTALRERGFRHEAAQVINEALTGLEPSPAKSACALLGKPRATLYRQRNPRQQERIPGRARRIPRRCRRASRSNCWRCSTPSGSRTSLRPRRGRCSSMRHVPGQRLHHVPGPARADQVRERRAQAAHPARARPELTADGPSQIWSWDITKLKGPSRGVWFDLFVMLDIFSRKAIRWEVHATENAELAKAFIDAAVTSNGGVAPLSIHADRGTSMTSKPSPCYYLICISARAIPGRTSRTTTLSAKRSSRPSNTARRSPDISGPSPAPGIQRGLLRLLQQRAPPLRHRPAYPRIRPRRHRQPDPGPPRPGPSRPTTPAPAGSGGPRTAPAARQGLDQPAPRNHRNGGETTQEPSHQMSHRD